MSGTEPTGVQGLRAFVAEAAGQGVTVNGIATPLFAPQAATMTAEKRERLRGGVSVGRFGESAEAAHAVLFLAAREGGYVTGRVPEPLRQAVHGLTGGESGQNMAAKIVERRPGRRLQDDRKSTPEPSS